MKYKREFLKSELFQGIFGILITRIMLTNFIIFVQKEKV